ncbi:MAG: radical SAM protein [Desulfobacterales bacterium]|jgi:radical SAM superfamily enzyme YgiQ (UPF0313 family)|nr:radical SAM protein [Desulfobacterales bacterium]
MKKILMISPARRRAKNEDFVFKMSFLNLPYLAAATPPEYAVEIVDEAHRHIDFAERPWLVALSAQTPVAPRAYEIAREFKQRGVRVVMGGVHASTLPQEALQYVDSVIIGEGEFIWPTLLSDLEKGALKPIYEGGTDRDLTGLPRPRRDLLNPRHYIPLTMVETTRGCPHQCDFCGVSRFFGHKYRKRPVAEVIAELSSLFGSGFRHSISQFFAQRGFDLPYFIERRLIYFIDSNFGADTQYTSELLEALKAMDVLWWAHATVDIANDDAFLRLMRDSGGLALNIGFETLSGENLKTMHKSFAGRFDYAKAVQKIHRYGIGVMGTFVVGFDNEEAAIFDDIYQFALDTQLDWALVFIRTPYPGTSLYEEMRQAGRLLTTEWEKYDTLNCVISPIGMNPEALETGLRRTWKKIFSLPSIHHRIIRSPRVHPLFYLGMNLQFFHLTRTWK